MAAHLYVKNASSVWSEGTLYIKVSSGSWQPANDAWVKTGPSTWESFYSSTFTIDNTPLVNFDLTSGSATYSNNDLYQFYGTNYHFTPTPTSISANFKMFNPQSGNTTTLKTYTGLTNPSSGSSTRVPSSGYAYKLLQSDSYNRGGDTYITFGVTASNANGVTYTSTGSYTLRTPAAPTVTIDTNYQVSNQIKINWIAASSDDWYATNRYIVYYYDITTGTYTYGSSGSTNGTGGYGATTLTGTATFTGLNNSHTYIFYVLPTTGTQGYTPTNYSGYLGAVGTVTTGTSLAPVANSSPSITGNAYPGGTVTVSNATWSITPTAYTYDWYKSTDFQTYVSMGLTTQSITIPSDFVSSGYHAVKCYVTAYYNSIPSDPNGSYPLEIISQQLATPTLSVSALGYSVYPAGYANVTIGNYYTAYTGNETWSASISPTLPVGSITKNQEFPEEWNFANLTAGTQYTVTISVSRTGFTGASQTISFTALPLVASKPTFMISKGVSNGTKGYIGVYSANASSVNWEIWRTANGTGINGYGNTYSYVLYDSGTFSGTGWQYYDLPRNGYYYMKATGYNSQGTASAVGYSNGTGDSGTQANWFYTGLVDTPTAGGGYASGATAYLYWTAPVDYYNQQIGASILNNVQSYQIYWYPSNTTPSSGVTPDYTGITASNYTTPTFSGTRYFWVRSYTTSGNIEGTSSWVALGSVTISGSAPSGMSVSLAPSGTQMAGTTITATVSAATSGSSPITYTVQIFKATGVDPTNANTGLESGTTSASHQITSSEASGTPDRFIAYATATNSYGTQTAYSNVVTSTPYVAPGTAPSGLSVSLTPSGTQMAGTTLTASVSTSGGTTPITYSIQIYKATGADPTTSSTPLESGTTSATHTITSGEAAGTPDRFIAYATALNSYGSVSGYSNVVTSTPYVAPSVYAWYCTTSTQCGGVGNCSYSTPGYNASASGTGYNTTCSYNNTSTYPSCQSTTCSSCTQYYCTQYDYADNTSPNYYGHCYSVGACDAPTNTGGGCCRY